MLEGVLKSLLCKLYQLICHKPAWKHHSHWQLFLTNKLKRLGQVAKVEVAHWNILPVKLPEIWMSFIETRPGISRPSLITVWHTSRRSQVLSCPTASFMLVTPSNPYLAATTGSRSVHIRRGCTMKYPATQVRGTVVSK